MDFPSGNRETDRQTDRPGLVLLPLSPINTHEFMWVVRQKAKVKTSWRPLSAWWRRRRSDEECLSLSWWGWWFDEELEVKTMKSSAVVHVSVCLCSLRSLSKLFPDVFNPQTFFTAWAVCWAASHLETSSTSSLSSSHFFTVISLSVSMSDSSDSDNISYF